MIHNPSGEIEYSIIDIPKKYDKKFRWCYSAKELEKQLKGHFSGNIIRSVYVDLEGYLGSSHHDTNRVDLSFENGGCIVAFENEILYLIIHAEGLFKYSFVPIESVVINKVKGLPPKDSDKLHGCFFDIENHDTTLEFTNQTVEDIKVIATNCPAFLIDGADAAKLEVAAKSYDLPREIDIFTKSCKIRIIGDELEYFAIKLERI